MNTKVLQLESWMRSKQSRDQCVNNPDGHYKKVVPVFNRDGYYYRNGVAWFEVGGEAWSVATPTMFLHTLNTLSAFQTLNEKDFKAIEHLVNEGLASVTQRRLFYNYLSYIDLRDFKRRLRHDYKRKLGKLSKETTK